MVIVSVRGGKTHVARILKRPIPGYVVLECTGRAIRYAGIEPKDSEVSCKSCLTKSLPKG